MNVGDLLDARVHGADGRELGVVVDVRLVLDVRDEPEDRPGGAQDREERDEDAPLSTQARRDAVGGARLVGLLVGPRGAGSFHGYERRDVRSPWPIAPLLRRRHRGTYLVRWSDVAAVGTDGHGWHVRLAPDAQELPPDLP